MSEKIFYLELSNYIDHDSLLNGDLTVDGGNATGYFLKG